MTFGESVSTVLGKYTVFDGRARRSEFWWFVLFQFLLSLVASIVDAIIGTDDLFGSRTGLLQFIVAVALFLPGLAVTIRRLHDTDRSGWWFLIVLIPFVGAIVLLVFCVFDSTPGPNKYGPSPKEPQLPPSVGYPQP